MKKIISLLVILIFSITLIPVIPVLAEVEVIDFTFKDKESNGTYKDSQKGYAESNNAIKLSAAGNNARATVGSENLGTYGFTNDNSLVMTMRIKFSGEAVEGFKLTSNMNIGNYGAIWSISGDAESGKYIFNGQTEKNMLDADRWYNVIMHFKGIYVWTHVFDDETGEKTGYKYSQTYSAAPTDRPFYIWSSNTSESGLIIDETKVYTVNQNDEFYLIEGNSSASDAEIETNGEVTLSFNQSIAPSKTMFSVKNVSGNTVSDVIESVLSVDFNTVKIKFTGLSEGKTYILDFSDAASVSGNPISGTKSLTLKTPSNSLYTDDFENTLSSSGNSFINSEIFSGNEGNGTCSIAKGYNGVNGLKLTGTSLTGVNSHVKTHTFESFGLNEETNLIFTVRFKFEGSSEKNVSWSINPNSSVYALTTLFGGKDGKFYADSSKSYELKAGEWYNMAIKFCTSGRNEMTINDAKTGDLICYKTSETPADIAKRMLVIQSSSKVLTNETSLTLSEAKVYCTKNSDIINVYSNESTGEGARIYPDGGVSVAFDKPFFSMFLDDGVPTQNKFKVSEGVSIKKICVKDFTRAVVFFNGLDYSSNYTLDYSNLVFANTMGLDPAESGQISFKTSLYENRNYSTSNKADIYTDFSGTEFSENGGISEGTPIKLEVTNNEKENFYGTLIYSFYYDGKLIGTETGQKIRLYEGEESRSVTYLVKKQYESCDTLKVMLWTDFNTIIPLAEYITARKATGADAPSSQYKIFGEQPSDKLAQQMPTPFSLDNYGVAEISNYNFNNFDFGTYNEDGLNICGDFVQSFCQGLWSIVPEGGVDNSPCVKLETSESVNQTRFQLVYKADFAQEGDWYVCKFKVRGENLTSSGSIRPYLEFANDKRKNAGSEYGNIIPWNQANSEWVECFVTLRISEGANSISEKSDYYNIYLNAFMNNMPSGSAAYIDDFSLSKIVFEPMDTVLVTPNYKGFVYGDDGFCDINLKIYINDYNGDYNSDAFSLECSLVDENDTEFSKMQFDNISSVNDVTFSSKVLPKGEGDYYLKSVLFNKEKETVVQKQEWTIRKRNKNYRPEVYVDEYNRFIKDGKPVLPIFQYAHGNIYEEYIDIVKNTAIDAFTVAGEYHTGYRTPRMQKFRKALAENNIGAMLEACGYVYSHLYTGLPETNVKKQSDIRSLLTVLLNNFKNDPQLWVYRTFDEENAVHYGEELRWQNDIMASVDPDHPTMGVTDKLYSGRPGIYSKTADIIGVDPYFCTGKEEQDLSRVGDMIRQFKLLNPGRPVFATLQGFWFKSRGDLRGPTQQEYRNMAWQAVCEGVTAIDNYSYTDLKANPWGEKDAKTLWDEQMAVLSEIKEFEPVILSTLPAPHYITDNTSDLIVKAARYNGKSYIFAVNVRNAENVLKIKLDEAVTAKEHYTNNNVDADSNGFFNITMQPYGVVILEMEQADYLSSHAEIIRFGVTNDSASCFVMNSDSDNSVISIENGIKEIDYLVTSSADSSISINGVSAEKQGSLNVENLQSITIRVTSENGKFYTEKTYQIARY